MQDLDYRMDVVKPILSRKITRKGIKVVTKTRYHRQFDSSKTSGLGLVVEHFHNIEQLLTAHSLYIINQIHFSAGE